MGGPVSTEPLWEAFHICSVDTTPGAVLVGLAWQHRRNAGVDGPFAALRAVDCGIAAGKAVIIGSGRSDCGRKSTKKF
jgi:hypothetical protein